MDSTKEIKEALYHSLLEWGVDSDSDQRFRNKVLQKGMELASLLSSSDRDSAGRTSNKNVRNKPSPICFDHLRPNKFPRDVQSAYELALRSDVESLTEDKCVLYEDRLQDEINGFGEPYFKWIDKSYKLKREYTGIASHRLNPLYRYTFERHTKPSFLFKSWFTNEDVESDMGTFLEACWSCHAIQKESCFHCNSRNSLRWSGGFGSSWQDLVCVECRCMYELKTKASMEKIESTYYHNNLNSGSFSAYCEIERARRVDDPNGHRHKVNSGGGRPKMFLVLLPRTFTVNRKRQKIHPVSIAEIDTIIPKLSETNFNPDKEKVSFKSRTTMNLRSKTKWFDLPFSGEDVDLPATKKKIYIECFGQEVFNVCGGAGGGDEGASSSAGEEKSSTLKVGDGPSHDTGTNTRIENVALASTEDLVAKLDNLKMNDEADDWDAIYESD